MYELKGVPQPPKRTRGGNFRKKKFDPKFDRKRAGIGPRVSKAYRVGGARGGRGRGGRSGGSSIFSRLMRRIMAQAGLRRPSIRQMFRQKSAGDGRNHGYGGVKKRNGRTGFAGR